MVIGNDNLAQSVRGEAKNRRKFVPDASCMTVVDMYMYLHRNDVEIASEVIDKS